MRHLPGNNKDAARRRAFEAQLRESGSASAGGLIPADSLLEAAACFLRDALGLQLAVADDFPDGLFRFAGGDVTGAAGLVTCASFHVFNLGVDNCLPSMDRSVARAFRTIRCKPHGGRRDRQSAVSFQSPPLPAPNVRNTNIGGRKARETGPELNRGHKDFQSSAPVSGFSRFSSLGAFL